MFWLECYVVARSILVVSHININYLNIVIYRVNFYFAPRYFGLEKYMGKFLMKGLPALCFCCCLFGKSLAEENKVIEVRTIGIPPYGIQIDEKLSGVYFDAINRLTSIAGYRVNNKIAPYARIIHELKGGITDMTIMFKYPQLEEHVIYIAPLKPLKIVVMGLEGVSFDSLSNLKGKSVAYLRGAKFSDAIGRNPSIDIIETVDFIQAMKLLMIKRVDGIIGPMDPILIAASRLRPNEQVLGQPLVVDQRTPWIQISKESNKRLSAKVLKQAFEKMKRNGELEAIRAKYISPRPSDEASAP